MYYFYTSIPASTILLSIVSALLIIPFYNALLKKKRSLRMPPGPTGFPLLGHLPLMVFHPGRKLLQWSKVYGPVFSVKLGSFRTVVLNDVESIREAFRMNSLSARPPVKFIKDVNNNKGITMADECSEQRQFLLQNMRKIALEAQTAEFYMHAEITEVIKSLESQAGQVVKIANVFDIATINGIWARFMTGQRFEPTGSIPPLLRKLSQISGTPSPLHLAGFLYPLLAKWLPNLSGYNYVVRAFEELHNQMADLIESHDKTRCRGNPRDIADAYLDKVDQVTDENSTFHKKHDQATITFSDVFAGATETTSGTMEWLLLYLAKHQKVQVKLQAEIAEAVGNTFPSLTHRPSMPYTEAILHEVLRLCPTLPLGVGHYSMDDTQFRGFLIPKGSMVIANIYGIHHNPRFWGKDVETFRPERFISEQGVFQKPADFIAFSAGKRSCPGDAWAKDMLFLYITRIFQKFHVELANEKTFSSDSQGTFGVTLRTKPFYLIFTVLKS